MARSTMLMFMLIPIACTADLSNLFTDDENASFHKVAATFSVSIGQRVVCRFIASYLFIAIGVVLDLIMMVILSSLTDIFSFGNFCGVIITFASFMLIYISMFILLAYFLGNGKITYANVIPLLIAAIIFPAGERNRGTDSTNSRRASGFLSGNTAYTSGCLRSYAAIHMDSRHLQK